MRSRAWLVVAGLLVTQAGRAQQPDDPGSPSDAPATQPNPAAATQATAVTIAAQKDRAQVIQGGFEAFGCDKALMLCLSADDGELLKGEVLPLLVPGDVLVVRSIATDCEVRDGGEAPAEYGKVELAIDTRFSADTLFAPPADPKKESTCKPTSPKVAERVEQKVSSAAGARAIVVRSLRRREGKVVPASEAMHEIAIDQGRYFLEVGALVPVVINGSRTVGAAAIPGTPERMVVIEEDARVTGALVLNVFPFGGRSRGKLYTGLSGNSWGLQVGIDLDFGNLTDQFYAGLLCEPISGFGISVGVAIVEGQVLTEGSRVGMLVPPGETVPHGDRYMARTYIGVTFTTEVLQTLLAGATAIKGIKAP
jgi:hypothetical protein